MELFIGGIVFLIAGWVYLTFAYIYQWKPLADGVFEELVMYYVFVMIGAFIWPLCVLLGACIMFAYGTASVVHKSKQKRRDKI